MKKLFLYLNLFFVIGCAQTDLSDRNDIAIIDTRGVDESVFKKDYSECSDFAKNIDLTERTLKQGAVAGATGAAVGAIIGGEEAAKKIGGSAAVLNAVEANLDGRNEQAKIIKNCLRGRGYKVLN
ncbi:MAG: glycine zipper family protein [Pseudomonadota bacterium]|nr:glycine zipper family protein [Pseudomonadota bacterium]